MKNIKKANWLKIIIGVVIIIAVGYVGYRYFNQSNQAEIKNEIQASGATKAVSFSQGISFTLPADHKVNFFSGSSSLIIPKAVTEYDLKNYQETLDQGIIIVQTITAFNENNEVFEQYINSRFKSNDKISVEVKFTDLNKKRLATVNLDHLDDDFQEIIKVLNLAHPVLLAASKSSDKIDEIINSVENIQ